MLVRQVFAGIRPRVEPLLLRRGEAEAATDCDFRAGSLRPLPANRHVLTLGTGKKAVIPCGVVSSGFREGHTAFLELDRPTQYVIKQGRTSFLDSAGNLCYAPHTGTDNPPTYLQSLPQPPSTVLLVVDDYGTPAAEDATWSFAYSLVNIATGDESSLSNQVNQQIDDTQTAVTASLPVNDVNALRTLLAQHDLANIRLRLYMSVSGDFLSYGEKQLVADTGLKFTLDFTDLAGGKRHPWPSADVSLPSGLSSLVAHPGNFIAVAKGDTIHMSDPLNVGMFPPGYTVKVANDVLRLEEHLSRLVVFYKRLPHQVIGLATPAIAIQVDSPENAPPCLSGDSVLKTTQGILYATREGPVLTDGYSSQYVLPRHYDERSFAAWHPGTVRFYGDRLNLLISAASGVRNAHVQDGEQMTMLSERIESAVYHDARLWLVVRQGTALYLQEAFADTVRVRRMSWLSAPAEGGTPQELSFARVLARYREEGEQYVAGLGTGLGVALRGVLGSWSRVLSDVSRQRTVSLNVFQDGQRVWAQNLPIAQVQADGQEFSMPTRGQAKRWQVLIEGEAEVQQVALSRYGVEGTPPMPEGQG